MAENQTKLVMEHRKASIVLGKNPTSIRKSSAHFLQPCFSPRQNQFVNLPGGAFTFHQNKVIDPPLDVHFDGWQNPLPAWKYWVLSMHSEHEGTWKKVGIYEAIMNSTFKIHRNENLLLGLSRKWCPNTKSFILKWGETSITLEDIYVLGGYSVTGGPIYSSHDEKNDWIEKKLMDARRIINKSKLKKVNQAAWIKLFKDNESEFNDIEHEAFLVFWLSRYVFPNVRNVVRKDVHRLAIRLARGVRIALAPAVLASIYKDLGTLKAEISINENGNVNQRRKIKVWSSMQLVQAWAWERFPPLRPSSPNELRRGQPMMRRWHKVNYKKAVARGLNVGLIIENASDSFLWRPYVELADNYIEIRNLYKEREQWVLDCKSLQEDVVAFLMFIRASELVGLSSIEQYLPHRVARQFGFDQDIPCRVPRGYDHYDHIISWYLNYIRELEDERFYIPPRVIETGVTTRYFDWWNRSKSVVEDDDKPEMKF